MIVESFVYALSYPGTPKAFRPHLADAVGLWARGQRQFEAWAPHIARTRGLIDTMIDDVAPRRTVAVLGSGPLFDVPLEALARTFETVLLVDQAHLATTNRRLRRYPHVRRQWHDLSAATNPDHLGFLGRVPDLDWVISLNLLSQLAHWAPQGEARGVVDAHLDGLAVLPCPVTLVTDLDYRVFGRNGGIKEQFDLLHGRPLPPSDQSWLWEVAPLGEESGSIRRVHSVAAWLDWRKSAGAKEFGFIR
ncbi:MAG: hypothetical protein Q8L54_14250 [Devosia sp.]|nr:hypothetical protein [Devosia sp.]